MQTFSIRSSSSRPYDQIRRNMWQAAIRQSLQADTSAPAWRPEPGLSEKEISALLRGRRYEDAPEARVTRR